MASPTSCLVKSLQEEFRNADYSRWARQDRGRSRPGGQGTRPAPRSSLPPIPSPAGCHPRTTMSRQEVNRPLSPPADRQQHTHTSVGSRSSTARVLESPASSACRHLWRKKAVESDPKVLQKRDNIRVLKFLIRSRKQAIAEFEKHYAALQETNLRLAQEIREEDRISAVRAREFLNQHEKLGDSIGGFDGWSRSQIGKAKADLEETESTLKKGLQGLEEQLNKLKTEVCEAQTELHTLKTYKDKQYPVKALRIAEMQREIVKLQETHQDEREDIQLLAQSEMGKLEKSFRRTEDEMLSAVAEEKMTYIPPGVEHMLFHNSVMKKEIELHQKMISELEEKTQALEKTVQQLQQSRADIRKEIFCDVFPRRDKCAPDMDVTLNIPREEWLPI
ncbi:uncharacterized protein C20orf96 homolog [Lepisosteus oculatus]|uniref:uncharacterized protein C20orf96 homolog n=1 Tax=Lepisosteus oculatus TaxID=7918 RepID=UPI0035F51A65